MKSFMLILIGLWLIMPNASNAELVAPPAPGVQSSYVEAVIARAEEFLEGVEGNTVQCDGVKQRAQYARMLRDLLFEVPASVQLPQEDVMRTACFSGDARTLEEYVTALIDLGLQSAGACNLMGASAYEAAADYVWEKLWQLRRFGLDPSVEIPVDGSAPLGKPPLGATAKDDDARCPYHSVYAERGFGEVGCREGFIAQLQIAPFAVERDLLEKHHRLLDAQGEGVLGELGWWHEGMKKLRADAHTAVKAMSFVRFVTPPTPTLSKLVRIVVENIGESGCKSWPSDIGEGGVTGKHMSRLLQSSDFVLTKELRTSLEYLDRVAHHKEQEYVLAFREEQKKGGEVISIGGIVYEPFLQQVNSEHHAQEVFMQLALQDVQSKIATIGNDLHTHTRTFAQQVVVLPGEEGPKGGPPLRRFAQHYITFLQRMCQNRGCADVLMRSLELSMREECFSRFLMAKVLEENGSLKPCRAIYTDWLWY